VSTAVEPDELRARVATHIRELAARKRLRLTELADLAGVSRGHLWSVLGGEKSATLDYLCRLARVLEVDPHELVRPPRKPRSPG
jgi:transcriptional regulator with XRE-family HTH domain